MDTTPDTPLGVFMLALAGGEHDTLEVPQTRKDELHERAQELVHLLALELYLHADGYPRAYPPAHVLPSAHDLHPAAAVPPTAALLRLARECAEGHEGAEEVAAVRERVLLHRVQGDLLELHDVRRGGHWRGLLAHLRAANDGVLAVFCVGVFWVVGETDLPWWGARF